MPKDDYAGAALLERWITQYGDMLVRLAYGMLRDRVLCQDAAQDTLLKAWRGYHTFRGECTEKTYLTGILMNTCRDYLRTAWMRRIDRRFTPDTLPEPYADAAPRDRTVVEAVLSLPLPQRQAVLLRYWQGLTIAETAQALRLSPEARQQVRSRAYGKARNRPKRLVFVLAVCLMLALLATATALTVQRSQNAQAVALARQELSRKYGLSARTLGVFDAQLTRRGGVSTVVFQSQAFPAVLTGTYTVQVSQGTASASWSYDAVSPSVYASGALSAPVWGAKQLERALAEPAAAMPYQLAAMARSAASPSAAPASPPPEAARILQQEAGASYWNGEILRSASPGADDLNQGAAFSLACQALAEEFHLDEAVLRDARLLDASFSSRSNGGTLWGFSLYLVDQDVACDYGVMLDGKTGEILMTNVITGANE